MTRKHFIKLAEALKSVQADIKTIDAIARVCESENHNFDWFKFVEACKSSDEACQCGQLFYFWWLFTSLNRRGEVKRGKYAPFLCLIDRRGEKGGYIYTYLQLLQHPANPHSYSILKYMQLITIELDRPLLFARHKVIGRFAPANSVAALPPKGLYRIGISRQ